MDPCKVARPDYDVESDHTRLGLDTSLALGLGSHSCHRCGSLHLEGLRLFEMNYSVCMGYSNPILIGKVSGKEFEESEALDPPRESE
jgi:hypothetical protein